MDHVAAHRLRHFVRPYLVALCALAVVIILWLVVPHQGAWRSLVTFGFLLAIMASAWWGGYGPGILVTFLTVFALPPLLNPKFDPTKINYYQVSLVFLISILISRVAAARRKVETALRLANERLDERVRQRTAELERANNALREREVLLVKQADELARSNADLQQFAYLASHDLQEPLRMIAIYTQLLARKYQGNLDSDADTFIDIVLGGVRRMEALIRDLLGYSRIIHADGLMLDAVDVNTALGVAMSNLQTVIEQSGAAVRFGVLPKIVCDRTQVTQVFQNLLSNALKYRSDAPPEIFVHAEEKAEEWEFAVRDNGIGIASDYHSSIFEPFKRLHGYEYPGTGVGLAICRRIIERHGGSIWVESQQGMGSTFRFTLPVALAHALVADRGVDSSSLAGAGEVQQREPGIAV
jgi:signal transduction histidine kinase